MIPSFQHVFTLIKYIGLDLAWRFCVFIETKIGFNQFLIFLMRVCCLCFSSQIWSLYSVYGHSFIVRAQWLRCKLTRVCTAPIASWQRWEREQSRIEFGWFKIWKNTCFLNFDSAKYLNSIPTRFTLWFA